MTSTEFRVKRGDALRLKGTDIARYCTSRPMIVDAVQCASTKTIATDLGFINVKRGDWVVCGEGGECYVVEDAFFRSTFISIYERGHFLRPINQTILT